MARYEILAPMLTMPTLVAIAEADTPDAAVRTARELIQQGRRGLQIGDTQAAEYFPIDTFAAKHGVR